jgi:L-threonylcarbamoyladenylate synthase
MPTIAANDPRALAWATDALARGELVVIPTDTVYGLAARLDRPDALARIYAAKGRGAEKALPVLIADPARLLGLTDGVPAGAAAFAAAFWPGPLTLVLPRSAAVPDLVTAGGPTVGLRMPEHPFALVLLAACGGALAVTSANRSGEPSLREAAAVAGALGDAVDLIVDGGPTPGGVASTVVALAADGPRILRAGPIDEAALRAAWAATRGR